MAEKQEYIGKSSLTGKPDKLLKFVLGPGVVKAEHLSNGCVNADNISQDFLNSFAEEVSEKALELISGKFIVNKFGNSTEIGISQKLLTDTVNDLYAKLREMNGEPPVGLYMNVTPEYYIGEEGSTVNIEAISTSGVFEYIAFYVNDVLLSEAEYVYRHQAITHIDDDVTIKCNATIMGMDYTVEKKVRHYNSFWLGAGNTYEDVMTLEHIIPVEKDNLRGAYDITCGEGERFFIILGSAFKDSYIRADLNGFEIPFTSTKITKDGNDYWVYTSDNQYHAGTYNIDING